MQGFSSIVIRNSSFAFGGKTGRSEDGDIVLCSDMTFAATVNPVSYERGVQVFVDSERETWNMNPKALELALKKYEGKAKVSYCGKPLWDAAKLDKIQELC